MPDRKKAKTIKESKIGAELTDEQCAVLSELVEVGEYADGSQRVIRQINVDDDEIPDMAIAHELRGRSQIRVGADRDGISAAQLGDVH